MFTRQETTSNSNPTQSTQISRPRRDRLTNSTQPPRGVWQDNPTPNPARPFSPQPAPLKKAMRSHPSQTKSLRSQKRHISNRKTVQLVLWVKPGVKGEVQRIADQDGLSVSQTGATFLENALKQNLYTQHMALLDPIIDKAIAKHLRSYSTRLAVLLVRVAFASEQTRSLVTNILSKQPGVSAKVLTDILDQSSKAARGKITYKTPQLESMIAEVEQWFTKREHEHNG